MFGNNDGKKSFNVLATSLSVLHNYFYSSIKFIGLSGKFVPMLKEN